MSTNQYILSFSPTGGTLKCANLLAAGLGGEWNVIDLTAPTAQKEQTIWADFVFEKEDIVIAAVPSFGGRVPLTAVERLGRMKGNGATAVLMCVYGNRAYDDTLTELQDVMNQAGFVCVAAVAALAEHSVVRQFAAGRPDEKDVKVLADFGKQIREKIMKIAGNTGTGNAGVGNNESTEDDGNLCATQLVLPGNYPHKERGKSTMHPQADDKCVACGLCAAKCPVQAIEKENIRQADPEKCISCLKCIAVCPMKTRKLPEQMLTAVTEKLSIVCQGRKENELFL